MKVCSAEVPSVKNGSIQDGHTCRFI